MTKKLKVIRAKKLKVIRAKKLREKDYGATKTTNILKISNSISSLSIERKEFMLNKNG